MCAVTHRAKLYQIALLIKKRLDDTIATQQSACEATLHTSIKILCFFLIYALFVEIAIDTFKEWVFYIIYKLKLPLPVAFKPKKVQCRVNEIPYIRHKENRSQK